MSDPITKGSRAAARRLSPRYGTQLTGAVEAALFRRDPMPPDQYLDPIALGSLIVAAATMAWTVYNDLRSKNGRPPKEDVISAVHIRLQTQGSGEYDEAISIAVEETLEAIPDDSTDLD